MTLSRSRSRPVARSGIALILALVILAALMLMGLPFLFSQSSSLAGTRYLAAGQAVRLYADSARNLGLAVAVYAHERYLADSDSLVSATPPIPAENWTTWIPTLADYPNSQADKNKRIIAAVDNYDTDRNTVQLAPEVLPQGWNPAPTAISQSRAVIGVSLSDEQGKLDINSLGPQGWKSLFDTLNIVDPDDSLVNGADRIAANYVNIDSSAHDDASTAGQLADGLALYRMDHTFFRLEDLLGVKASTDGLGSGDPDSFKNGSRFIFRTPLSRAELDTLRPYLTVSTLGQARGGVADLGNVIEYDGPPHYNSLLVDLPKGEDLIGFDSWLEGPDRKKGVLSVGGLTAVIGYTLKSSGSNPIATDNDGVWLRIPPVLNANTVTKRLRAVVTIPNPPIGAGATPKYVFESLADIKGAAGFVGLGPLWPFGVTAFKREWPQLATASDGVVSINTRATIYDAAGNPLADAHHKAVVQAVPQESFIERRWKTQSDYEQLQLSRAASRMQSWPIAFERDNQQQPKSVTDDRSTALKPQLQTGIATRPQRNLAWETQLADHTQIDWRLPLGGSKAQPGDAVFADLQSAAAAPTSTYIPLGTPPDRTTDLRPDGLVIKPTTAIAYQIGVAGPLKFVDPNDTREMAPTQFSFWFQPQDDWSTLSNPICLAEARMRGDTVGKTHSPGGKATAPIPPLDTPASTSDQNYFGIWYDPAIQSLALVIAPPTIPWDLANSGEFAMGKWDASRPPWIDSDLDFSSLGWDYGQTWTVNKPTDPLTWLLNPQPRNFTKTTAFSPLLSANRICHFFYIPNLRQWQWYNLQACIGTTKPGGIAMLLDQFAGSDVTRLAYDMSNPYIKQPGDQVTLPSLILSETNGLKALLPPTDAGTEAEYYPASISVTVPSIVADKLNVRDLLPARGTIQVGQEYIAYDAIDMAIQPDKSVKLLRCRRGVRQNTQTDASLTPQGQTYQEWPGTRFHARGDQVLPGDVRVTMRNGRLFAGGCDLADSFSSGDLTTTSPFDGTSDNPCRFQVWGALQSEPSATKTIKTDDTIQLLPSFGSLPGDWPTQGGIVRILLPSQSTVAFFSYDSFDPTTRTMSGLIALPIINPDPTGEWEVLGRFPTDMSVSYGGGSSLVQPYVWLVSINAGDTIDPTSDERYPYPDDVRMPPGLRNKAIQNNKRCYLQLLAPDGTCEWIEYQTIVKRRTKPAGSTAKLNGYFLHHGGWGRHWQSPSNPGENFISRGRMRTVFQAGYLGPNPIRTKGNTGYHTSLSGGALINTDGLITTSNSPGTAPPFTFPTATKLIPVQIEDTQTEDAGRRLMGGDVVTILPRKINPANVGVYPGPFPIQRTVRFVSTDGYGNWGANVSLRSKNDVRNGYFAFTDHLPKTINTNTDPCDLAVGTAWSTSTDLSSQGPLDSLSVCMRPRLDGFYKNWDLTSTGDEAGRLVIGNSDQARYGGALPAADQKDIAIDGVCSGRMQNKWESNDQNSEQQARIMRFVKNGVISFTMSTTELDVILWSSTDLFNTFTLTTNMGLISLSGKDGSEAMAWRKLTTTEFAVINSLKSTLPYLADNDVTINRVAKVVGRGLLGTTPKSFSIATLPSVIPASPESNTPTPPVRYGYLGLPALSLPVGPVAMLADPSAPNPLPNEQADLLNKNDKDSWFLIGDGLAPPKTTWNAPALSIWDADGSGNFEILAITDPSPWPSTIPGTTTPEGRYEHVRSAPWLRGVYGTKEKSWYNSSATHPPIVIGWWPRYASALPATVTEQHYRSRQYAWAGYPARFHRMRVDKDHEVLQSFDSNASPQLTNPYLILKPSTWQFRVMAGSAGPLTSPSWTDANWSHMTTQVSGGLPDSTTISDLFDSPTFWDDTNKAMIPVDGVELRVAWQYPDTINDGTTTAAERIQKLASYANYPVKLAPMVLRVRAPATVISTSER